MARHSCKKAPITTSALWRHTTAELPERCSCVQEQQLLFLFEAIVGCVQAHLAVPIYLGVKMATGSACVSEWDEEEVAEAVAAEFGPDISDNFRGKH